MYVKAPVCVCAKAIFSLCVTGAGEGKDAFDFFVSSFYFFLTKALGPNGCKETAFEPSKQRQGTTYQFRPASRTLIPQSSVWTTLSIFFFGAQIATLNCHDSTAAMTLQRQTLHVALAALLSASYEDGIATAGAPRPSWNSFVLHPARSRNWKSSGIQQSQDIWLCIGPWTCSRNSQNICKLSLCKLSKFKWLWFFLWTMTVGPKVLPKLQDATGFVIIQFAPLQYPGGLRHDMSPQSSHSRGEGPQNDWNHYSIAIFNVCVVRGQCVAFIRDQDPPNPCKVTVSAKHLEARAAPIQSTNSFPPTSTAICVEVNPCACQKAASLFVPPISGALKGGTKLSCSSAALSIGNNGRALGISEVIVGHLAPGRGRRARVVIHSGVLVGFAGPDARLNKARRPCLPMCGLKRVIFHLGSNLTLR